MGRCSDPISIVVVFTDIADVQVQLHSREMAGWFASAAVFFHSLHTICTWQVNQDRTWNKYDLLAVSQRFMDCRSHTYCLHLSLSSPSFPSSLPPSFPSSLPPSFPSSHPPSLPSSLPPSPPFPPCPSLLDVLCELHSKLWCLCSVH